jgi:hypothetical protein
MCMIETMAHERFYKDVAHEPLRSALPKALVHRHTSPPPDVALSHTTRSGGASSSSTNFGFFKMFQGIFTMCCHIDQCMVVMDRRIDILRRNQKIIHSQRDEPLIEFLEEPVYPPVPENALLTQAELAAIGVGISRAPPTGSDDEDEEAVNNDEEMEDGE